MIGGLIRFFLPSAGKLLVMGITASIYAGVLAAGVGAYYGWRGHERDIGWNNALAYVAKQDAHSAQVATTAKNRVDACYDSGGTWNGSEGKCVLESGALSGVNGLFAN